MKEKFTKGPWRSDKWDIIGSDNSIVAKVLPWDSSGCRKEDGVNVTLITTAPKMYDTLGVISRRIQNGSLDAWSLAAIVDLAERTRKEARGE